MKELSVETLKKMLPLKLLGQNRWTVWVRHPSSGKINLYQPSEQQVVGAMVSDPYTWDAAEEALRALLHNPAFSAPFAEGQAGIAYVNSQATPLATIALYGAVQGDRKVAPWALRYLDLLDAYAEEGTVPGSLVFLWEGPLEPFAKAGISVQQPPFVALTLKKIPGSPPRVGTAKTRYAKFLELAEEVSQRYAQKIESRFAEYGETVAKVLSGLVSYGLRPRGEKRWLSRCPYCRFPKPTLTLALEDKLYLSCAKGCTPQDIVAALRVDWDEARFSAKPLKEELEFQPITDPQVLQRLEEAYLFYFNAPANHPLLVRYGISQEMGLDFGVGLEGEEGERLVVPTYLKHGNFEEGVLGFRTFSPHGEELEAFPDASLPWVSPGYREAEAFFLTDDLFRAMGVANILSRDPKRRWGVLFVPPEAPVPTPFLRKSPAREVYLWPFQLRRVQEWRGALTSLPYTLHLVPPGDLPFGANRGEVVQALQALIREAEPLL